MINWQKILIFSIVILYMVVNEGERIETRDILDKYIRETNRKVKKTDRQIEKIIEDSEIIFDHSLDHIHRYHDGKAMLPHNTQ